MTALYWVLAAVALQRLVELAHARRNTSRLMARGGIEHGAGHYPLIVAVHAGWLVTMVLAIPAGATIVWPLLAATIALQPIRYWAIATLGPRWTTRVITLADEPAITGGPYRFLRHPNYAVVAAEIVLLPLAFGAWQIAVGFGMLNCAVLAIRIRTEQAALSPKDKRAGQTDLPQGA